MHVVLLVRLVIWLNIMLSPATIKDQEGQTISNYRGRFKSVITGLRLTPRFDFLTELLLQVLSGRCGRSLV